MDSAGLEDQGKEISSHEVANVDAIETISFTHEEEKPLVKKVDLTLLPTIWARYLLSYMDRTKCISVEVESCYCQLLFLYSIGNAKVSGMEVDLKLTSNQYSIALVVLFVRYVIFEVPSKYYNHLSEVVL